MHLKASIEAGAVLPSLILRKLAAAGAGNALSQALCASGRIERLIPPAMVIHGEFSRDRM